MKCKWKDGKFTDCRDLGQQYPMGVFGIIISFCPFCGADIRAPSPSEPIIKKSGETWVASFEGVDYLRVGGTVFIQINKEDIKHLKLNPSLLKVHESWKPISEIEITDIIAKLRPLVVFKEGTEPRTLLAVEDHNTCKYVIVYGHTYGSVRLATVKDLEE